VEPGEIDPVILRSIFDYKDGELFWKQNRGYQPCAGNKAGRNTPYGYISVELNGRPYQAHRLVWAYHFGATDKLIDHIDGDRSNNRIENLRLCDRFENAHNRKKCRRNTTGVKGVRLRSDSGRFEARITMRGKRMVLGSYDDLELAELVVCMAREKYHGAFANHG
jgi:hypothetical protein